jgi:threonine synthase
MIEKGVIQLKGKKVVAVCTGHGLKDPDIISKKIKSPKVIASDFAALEKEILYE